MGLEPLCLNEISAWKLSQKHFFEIFIFYVKLKIRIRL
jgi:hypothetical protein